MTDTDLLVSTSLCSLVHFLTFVFIEAPFLLQFVHLLACYASMQYHTVPHQHLRWVNRVMTVVSFFVDYYYSQGVWSFQAMLWMSFGSYLWSKWFNREELYVFAQWMVTVNHVSMYVWYNTTNNFNKIRV